MQGTQWFPYSDAGPHLTPKFPFHYGACMGLCHWFFLNPPWSTEKVQGSWGQVGASGLQLSLTFFVSQISPQHLPFPGGAHTPPQRPLLFPRMCPR